MRRLLLATLLVTVIAVAGCGGSSSSSSATSSTQTASPTSSSAGAGTLTLAADPSGNLKFDKSSLSASAGKVTVDFTNSSSVPHNLTIAASGGQVVGATPTFQGGSKSLSVTLKPGTYTFYCSVPGHRQAGMQGTLIVK